MTTSPQPSDQELVDAARGGDREAAEALVLRHQPRVYRFALKACADPEAAKDVLQDTLFALVRSLGTFRGDAALSTWLYTVARNGCLRRRRRSKFAPAREESLDALPASHREALVAPDRSAHDQLADRERRDVLDRALATLDETQREVLVLRDIEGLTATEVAEVLDVSVDAVKSRLHRARVALRRQLADIVAPDRAAAEPAQTPETDPCRDVLELFSRHLENDLSREACAQMETHLAGCEACKGRCESLEKLLALCRGVPTPAVPAEVEQSVRQAIREGVGGSGGDSA